MRHETTSPLVPMRLGPPPERGVRYLDGLGAAADLLGQLPFHAQLPISLVVPLVIHALQDGRIYFALTEQNRPWGLAIWHWIDATIHANWLQTPPALQQLATPGFIPNGSPSDGASMLWFSLLVTPFCTSLPLLQHLQQRLPRAEQAWALAPHDDQAGLRDAGLTSGARHIW